MKIKAVQINNNKIDGKSYYRLKNNNNHLVLLNDNRATKNFFYNYDLKHRDPFSIVAKFTRKLLNSFLLIISKIFTEEEKK